MGVAGTGGYVPVDAADVVAHDIFAHFVELYPLSLENRVIFAAEVFVDKA